MVRFWRQQGDERSAAERRRAALVPVQRRRRPICQDVGPVRRRHGRQGARGHPHQAVRPSQRPVLHLQHGALDAARQERGTTFSRFTQVLLD